MFNEKREDDDQPQKAAVFEKYNKLLHGGIKPTAEAASTPSRKKKGAKKDQPKMELLTIPFLKKYLQYAKNRIKPTLTPEASEHICEKYAELRNREDGLQNMHRVMPITPRTLETLVRLSTANAKARLSSRVEKVDLLYSYLNSLYGRLMRKLPWKS